MAVAENWAFLTSKFGAVPEKGWQIANEIVMAAQAAGHEVTFLWGDGTSTGPQASAAATKTYGVGGTYTVTLRVADNLGRIAQTTQAVTVP